MNLLWMDNEEVLIRVDQKSGIQKVVNKRRKKWVERMMRQNDYMATLIEGRTDENAGEERS